MTWRDALARLQADDDLHCEIANSAHPACRRYMRWLCHEMLPALGVLGLGPGEYEWPGTPAEFEAMLAAAVAAVRPVQ